MGIKSRMLTISTSMQVITLVITCIFPVLLFIYRPTAIIFDQIVERSQPFLAGLLITFYALALGLQLTLLARKMENEAKIEEIKEFAINNFNELHSKRDSISECMQTSLNNYLDAMQLTLERHFRDACSVKYIGGIEEANAYVRARVRRASEVWNLQVGTARHQAPYDQHIRNFETTVPVIVESVRAGVRWFEIYSRHTVPRAAEIRKSLAGDDKYFVQVLSADLPIPNFIVFIYEHEKKEVLFGFGLHEHSDRDNIYASSDDKIVSHFEKYFRTLQHHYAQEFK